jgi:hypothetical protein
MIDAIRVVCMNLVVSVGVEYERKEALEMFMPRWDTQLVDAKRSRRKLGGRGLVVGCGAVTVRATAVCGSPATSDLLTTFFVPPGCEEKAAGHSKVI